MMPSRTQLADSLTARLDRLSADAKFLAQVGASIGREFIYRLIAQVSQMERELVDAALRDLESSGLVFRRGEPPDSRVSVQTRHWFRTLPMGVCYANAKKS